VPESLTMHSIVIGAQPIYEMIERMTGKGKKVGVISPYRDYFEGKPFYQAPPTKTSSGNSSSVVSSNVHASNSSVHGEFDIADDATVDISSISSTMVSPLIDDNSDVALNNTNSFGAFNSTDFPSPSFVDVPNKSKAIINSIPTGRKKVDKKRSKKLI
jgi:hypothetical protein